MSYAALPAWAGRASLGVLATACLAALARSPETALAWSLGSLVLALGALAVLVAAESRHHTLSRRAVLATSGLLLIAAVIVPPRRSTDVWAYANYGRMVAHHHVSPFTHAAQDFPDDPVARRVAEVWQDSPSVYGPVFVGVAGLGMALADTSQLAARLFFQGLAALAVGLALWLIDRRTRDPVAIAFVGLNPLTIVSVVNGGHNDAWVGLAVLGAVLLAVDRRPRGAGAALAAGAMVKVGALLPGAAIGLWLTASQGLVPGLVMAGVGAGVALGGLLVAGGLSVFDPLREASLRFTRGSVWWKVREWSATDSDEIDVVGRPLSALAGGAVGGFGGLMAWVRRTAPSPAPAVVGAVLAYMLLGSYVTPWYVAWSLPVMGLCWRSRLAWVAVAHAGLLLLTSMPRRIPDDEPLRGLVTWLYGGGMPLVEVGLVIVLVWWGATTVVRQGRGDDGAISAPVVSSDS